MDLRYVILIVGLLSGVGTLPCLAYLIYIEVQKQNKKGDL